MSLDFATIGGLLLCVVLVLAGILNNGDATTPVPLDVALGAFVDTPSLLIVGFGSVAAVAVCYPLNVFLSIIQVTKQAFLYKPRDTKAILAMLQDMSNRARREGTLALEEFIDKVDDDYFSRGVQLVVDGHEPNAIEDLLYNEIEKIKERHEQGIGMWENFALLSPAFGMIGTLIGLVKMLGNMDDPTAIGPSMAIALLTTLYGSLIANVFALPLTKKLKFRSDLEIQEKEIIAQGLLSILVRETPRFLVDRLNTQLAPSDRLEQIS
jgi:chemotaxis protein MotA